MRVFTLVFFAAAILSTFLMAQQKNHSLIGKTAPDFTLPTIDGKKIKLADLKGKVVLLNFFSHW